MLILYNNCSLRGAGMKCIPIELDIELPDDQIIDFFLLQWHTPPPFSNIYNGWKIPKKVAEKRFEYLNAFKEWLINEYKSIDPSRPVFIIAPELSLPSGCLGILESIAKELGKTAIIIAGLEYLKIDDFQELKKDFYYMSDDIKTCWYRIKHDQKINSACILVHEAKEKTIKKFIQFKNYLAPEEEVLDIYSGDYILYFKSKNRGDGRKIDFCVRICSDMTDKSKAEEFRKAIFGEKDDRVNNNDSCNEESYIDLTFLLQMNKNQNAEQFKNGVKGYFSPADHMIETQKGCLIAVNNAISVKNKENEYGKTRVYFKYDFWPLRYTKHCPYPTYWLENNNTYDFQVAEFRESSEGIYFFSYKPVYLISNHPGDINNPVVPLKDARFAYFNRGNLEGKPELEFEKIPALSYWLDEEWEKDIYELTESMKDTDKEDEYINSLKKEYCLSMFEKKSKTIDDPLLLQSMRIYAIACNKYKYCNNNEKSIYEESEPMKWCDGMSDSAKYLLRSYTMLKIAKSVLPESSINLVFSGMAHAKYGSNIDIVFLWGCNKKTFEYIVECLTHTLTNNNILSNLSSKILLVFNKLDSPPSKKDYIKRKLKESCKKINDSRSYDIEGINHFYRMKNQYNICSPTPEFSCIFDYWLTEHISRADDYEELKRELENVVKEAINYD
jgi:hypothetical protein